MHIHNNDDDNDDNLQRIAYSCLMLDVLNRMLYDLNTSK